MSKHPNLKNWKPCKNCPWIAKTEPNLCQEKAKLQKEKICLECQEVLSFIELEKGKYLCGKNKCLRNYIEKMSENNEE